MLEIDTGRASLPLEELLVHALAQLPEDVDLELPSGAAHLLACARAHGIEHRVSASASRLAIGGRAVAPRRGGAATAAQIIAELDARAEGHAVPRGDDRALDGARVAIVTNVPAPYRHGLFSRLQDRLRDAGAEMLVLFAGAGDSGRPWVSADSVDFRHEVMRSVEAPWGHRSPLFPRDLERRLRAFRPTVIVQGGMSPLTAPRTAIFAKATGAAFGVWSGELASAPTTRGRGALRRLILGAADFAIAYGTLAAAYLRDEARFRGPLVIGRNSSAFPDGERARPARPERPELVTVGDMATPGKGVDVLLDALARRPELPCRLSVIGGGALLGQLRARAAGDPRVTFAGPLPHREVQSRLLAADAYLTPTRLDRFGLALLEAMGAGVAPVMSTAPGLLADLGVHERNCLVVPDHEPESWAAAIERITLDHDLRGAMGDMARRTVRGRWSLDHAADSMIAGLRLGLERRRR